MNRFHLEPRRWYAAEFLGEEFGGEIRSRVACEKRLACCRADRRPVLTFPFGTPITPVKQADTTPKRVFVLGVYASAVHARWVADDGKTIINALGVASEPEIFWRGEEA